MKNICSTLRFRSNLQISWENPSPEQVAVAKILDSIVDEFVVNFLVGGMRMHFIYEEYLTHF
jgi:hypothetical protein